MTAHNRYIRATVLIGLQDLLESSGGDAAALLTEAGIDPKALVEPDSLIPFFKLGALLEVAAQRYGRPSLGLEWVLRSPPHFPNHGPLVLLGHFTGDMQDWCDTALQYWRYHTDAYTMLQRPDERTGHVAFRYQIASPAYPTRQITEMMIGAVICIFRKVGQVEAANPTAMRFQHARPRDLTLHDQVFRCPLEFGAEHDEVVVDPAHLTGSTGGKFRIFKPILGYYIKSRIQSLPLYDQTMATTAALAMRSVMGTGKCNIEFISAMLGLTSKKLQRLLAGEGTTFSDILDAVRIEMARQLLSTSDASVANIAGLLDYSATAPFTQAFKRWTGMTPLEFRKGERGNVAASGK